MLRTAHVNFQMVYVTELKCAIQGKHIYKYVLNPLKKETLFCWKTSWQEAAKYAKYAIGVFKSDFKLVGHVLIELSNLIDYFLESTEEKGVSAVLAG